MQLKPPTVAFCFKIQLVNKRKKHLIKSSSINQAKLSYALLCALYNIRKAAELNI